MNTPLTPVSVWACGQQRAHDQRRDHYIPESRRHPAKMAPAIARHAIATYSSPGDVVLDPMCGIGTVPVEATGLARHGYGLDYESQWTDIAAANLTRARQRTPGAGGHIHQGNAQHLTQHIPTELTGTVDLIVTSPPYGIWTHGYWPAGRTTKIIKEAYKYGPDPHDNNQLANGRINKLLPRLEGVLYECAKCLRPGGILVLITRPWIKDATLIDFPTLVTKTVMSTKAYKPIERCVALLARWDPGHQKLVARPTFFKLNTTRHARNRGQRLNLPAHEDVLVFRRSA